MFSISFGEGFDGYLAQPIHQGGLGFTAYNDDFFPSREFKNYSNIFENEDQMVKYICDRIRHLSTDRQAYVRLNEQFREEYRRLYSYDEYVEQIRKLCLKEFELFPRTSLQPRTDTEQLRELGSSRISRPGSICTKLRFGYGFSLRLHGKCWSRHGC